MGAIFRLSRESGSFPECLFLKDIKMLGRDPVAAGQFGEVWKGQVCGQEISIKVLKIYVKSDVEQFLKVRRSSSKKLSSY